MVADADAAVRDKGLACLRRFPFDVAAEALFPQLAVRSEPVRRATMAALESLAGPEFPAKAASWLEHRDPAVVHAALDFARKAPAEHYLPGAAKALSATAPSVRRKAFSLIEGLAPSSPKAVALAARALGSEDEDLRFRAIGVLAKHPSDALVAALLKRCHNDSPRVQEAAVVALTPLLSKGDAAFHPEFLPLLCDGNAKVRQLAVRILRAQPPGKVGRGVPPGLPRHVRKRAGPEHEGDRGARTGIRQSPDLGGPQRRPGHRVARLLDRGRDPLARGGTPLHPLSRRRRLLAARAGGARARGAEGSLGAPAPPETPRAPGVRALGGERPRRLGHSGSPAGPPRRVQEGRDGPAARDPGRLREDLRPPRPAAPRIDREGGPGSLRQREGGAPGRGPGGGIGAGRRGGWRRAPAGAFPDRLREDSEPLPRRSPAARAGGRRLRPARLGGHRAALARPRRCSARSRSRR